MHSYTLTLVRRARSKGGDLYQTQLDEDGIWKVYVPQCISRISGDPEKHLEIVIKNI